MADEQSTSTDTSADEVADTSVSDESTDDDDVELEDVEVSPEDIASEPEEAEESEDSKSEDTEETTDEPSEEESESSDEEEAELSDEDKQKQHNREMAERRIQEKQARITRVKEAQVAYVAEASKNEDPLDAAVRQLQVDAYNNTVESNTNSLTNGYERALKDFDVLRDASPEVQAEIDDTIEAFQAMNVSIDAYGNPTEVRGDLYATLQAKADSIEKLTGIRSTNQGKSKSKEKSKTLATPSRAPKEPKADPDMEAFDEEAKK